MIAAVIVPRMPGVDARMRATLRGLAADAQRWREEPMYRVSLRNRALRPLRTRQFHRFGAGAILERPQWLYGAHHIAIGDYAILLRPWLAVERVAWGKPAPVLTIGNHVAIRFGATISAADSIVLEDHVGIGAYVTIIDSTHTWDAGRENPMHNPIRTAPVRIGRGTWLADRATVGMGADIGEQCAIGPNTVVTGNVPDYSIVLGNPGRVVGSTRNEDLNPPQEGQT
jgi:acetyltransferase-like isoleucine patch superfamily enzyme